MSDAITVLNTAAQTIDASTAVMNSTSAALTSLVSLLGSGGFVVTHVMPHVPTPAADAPTWWKVSFKVLTGIAGNYRKAKNSDGSAAANPGEPS